MEPKLVNEKEMKGLAHSFVDSVLGAKDRHGALIVGLYGDLGAGKTTFAKMVAEELGVEGTVTSPTFVIEKIYQLPSDKQSVFEHLIHIDAYRLGSGEELEMLGWERISSDPKNIILIEWPERVEDITPDDMMKINFTFIDEETREIKM